MPINPDHVADYRRFIASIHADPRMQYLMVKDLMEHAGTDHMSDEDRQICVKVLDDLSVELAGGIR